MRSIVWLASYPKSGNTWVRAFLSHYRNRTADFHINRMSVGPAASSREAFDQWVGVDASDLTHEEIESYRGEVYRQRALRADPPWFVKVHDAYGHSAAGEPLFPAEATLGVVYVVRHPFDVAVSFAHHSGISIQRSVERLCNDHFVLGGATERLPGQLPQRLLSWSGHVRSWVDQSHFRIHVLRFEDLLRDPCHEFRNVLRFCGLDCAEERLAESVEASRFENLQAQERVDGFVERHHGAEGLFFRQGRAGGWRDVLSPADVRQLAQAHSGVMQRFGYEEG